MQGMTGGRLLGLLDQPFVAQMNHLPDPGATLINIAERAALDAP
jgi:hypothetical protein